MIQWYRKMEAIEFYLRDYSKSVQMNMCIEKNLKKTDKLKH